MLDLIITGDGSHSLFHTELSESYHSIHGAVQESQHVFIEQGLRHQRNAHPRGIQILEIGFGTGLNALLTLREALTRQLKVRYVTFEKFPIGIELASRLNYPQLLEWPDANHWFDQLHRAPWEQEVTVHPLFQLFKLQRDLTQLPPLGEEKFDLIYFDAFAPSRQPEMWTLSLLSHVKRAMGTEAFLVTYCAQGQFKRNLKELGLIVENLPGPPGKKEMVRALLP